MSLDIVTFKSAPIEIIDGDRGKNYPKQDEFTDDGHCLFLNAKNVTDDGFNFDTKMFISEKKDNLLRKGKLQKGDVILTTRGTVGNVAFYSEQIPYDNIRINSGMLILRSKKELDNEFLYWTLKSNYFKKQIYTFQSGTAQPQLPISSLNHMEFYLPPINIQKKIVKILSQIDNKIRISKEINKNLEQYLFYLFNEYFMEFDFNEFSNSNKTIPSSWKLGCFNDIIDSLGSGDWGKEEQTGNYISEVYCIRGADIPNVKQGNKGKMPIRFILPKNFEKRKLGENSIVIEISGGSPTQSTGRTVFITDNFLNRFDKDIICTNFCKVINPKNEYAIFLYLYLNYLYDKDVMFAYENGTTGIKNFDIKSFISNFNIVIPSIEDIIKFNNLVQNVFDVIMHNGLEIEQLQKLRDTLLPKLMSGEIDVSKINCDLE